MKFHIHYRFYIVLLICSGWLLSACGAATATPQATPLPLSSPTVTLTAIPTITPTLTPEPPVAVLLASAGSDEALVDNLQTSLNDMITAQGVRWQVRRDLSDRDLTPALRLVLALPPDPGLAAFVANAPDTQFIALGISGLEAAPNLTAIGTTDRPDRQGFIAGVLAAMIAPDWRVGAISLSDTVEGRATRTGFLNGVEYFCGLCRPVHPPYYEYPLYVELPSTATSAEWQEAANYMVDHYAQAVYVFRAAGDEAMLTTLADAGIHIISSGEPPQSITKSWVVSLTTNPLPLIQSQVEGLLNGSLSGGQSLAVPIEYTHLNPALLSPGKQRLADQILSDLLNDYIDTGVDLSTGEFRP